MINLWITIPLPIRYVVLAVIGMLLGALANYMILRWGWIQYACSPWGPADKDAPPRKFIDRIPIIGWLTLRREAGIHGNWFWLRPFLIELAMIIAIPAMYWFETQSGLILPPNFRHPKFLSLAEPVLTMTFLFHLPLFVLMVAATFIDFDEQTIPDLITIPGTILALVVTSFSIDVFLPANAKIGLTPCLFSIPAIPGLKWMGPVGWWTAAGIWSGYCFALADRRVILRKGYLKAVEFFLAGLVRHWTWKLLVVIWIVGLIGIRSVFSIGGNPWLGLFTSLVGLGVGGGVVWVIRIIASSAMGMEALGFGDVTLMAMIGAFLGWQAAVLSFFVAPVAAIFIVLTYFAVTRESRVPFGPYLCAGTVLTVVGWHSLFNLWFMPRFAILGQFMLWLFAGMSLLMGVMLFVWRLIKENLIYKD